MAARQARMRIADLVRNPDFHARQGKLDPMHVQRLGDAYETGARFPAIIVCDQTMIVLEGWHRCAATERVDGADNAEIDVELRTYADDAARFEEALNYAADSKLPLNFYNQQACVLRAEALGITPQRVAGLLNVPEGKLEKRRVTAVEKKSGNIFPLKAPFRHMENQQLTEAQRLVNERSDGRQVTWHADQIISRLRADMVNWTDTRMIKSLVELRDLLVAEGRLFVPDDEDQSDTGN